MFPVCLSIFQISRLILSYFISYELILFHVHIIYGKERGKDRKRERERERGRLSVDDVYKSGGGCCVLFLISLHLRLANGSGMIDPILATHAPGH